MRWIKAAGKTPPMKQKVWVCIQKGEVWEIKPGYLSKKGWVCFNRIQYGVVAWCMVSRQERKKASVIYKQRNRNDWRNADMSNGIWIRYERPPLFKDVIICRKTPDGRVVVEAGQYLGEREWEVYGTHVKKGVIAWMYLPKAPEDTTVAWALNKEIRREEQ